MKHGDSFGAKVLAFLGLGLLAACARPPRSTPPHAPEPHALQGYWETDGASDPTQLTVEGDTLWFYRGDDFQYDATFTLVPETDPPELHATILDTPRTTDSVGELVIAVYDLTDGVLDIAVVDKSDGKPTSFDQGIGRYRFERIQAP